MNLIQHRCVDCTIFADLFIIGEKRNIYALVLLLNRTFEVASNHEYADNFYVSVNLKD